MGITPTQSAATSSSTDHSTLVVLVATCIVAVLLVPVIGCFVYMYCVKAPGITTADTEQPSQFPLLSTSTATSRLRSPTVDTEASESHMMQTLKRERGRMSSAAESQTLLRDSEQQETTFTVPQGASDYTHRLLPPPPRPQQDVSDIFDQNISRVSFERSTSREDQAKRWSQSSIQFYPKQLVSRGTDPATSTTPFSKQSRPRLTSTPSQTEATFSNRRLSREASVHNTSGLDLRVPPIAIHIPQREITATDAAGYGRTHAKRTGPENRHTDTATVTQPRDHVDGKRQRRERRERHRFDLDMYSMEMEPDEKKSSERAQQTHQQRRQHADVTVTSEQGQQVLHGDVTPAGDEADDTSAQVLSAIKIRSSTRTADQHQGQGNIYIHVSRYIIQYKLPKISNFNINMYTF